ncbi:MAG: cation transporter [Chloroflexota bacterium]|nr:cation transporter [Chloroflexota bacterium]
MNSRARHLRRALGLSVLSIAWSASVGSFAVYSALASGSLSLLGFGADAVIDAAASIALVWRFLVEARDPKQANRVERTAEGVVGLALMALAFYLAVASVGSLAAGSHPEVSSAAVAHLLASIVVLSPLAIAKRRVAASLGSGALRADSVLTAVAALLAAISLTSIAAVQAFGFWWADAAAALVVAVVVVREGWSSLRASRSVG